MCNKNIDVKILLNDASEFGIIIGNKIFAPVAHLDRATAF